jgi:hypothetical protein
METEKREAKKKKRELRKWRNENNIVRRKEMIRKVRSK